ncbi:MAG: hypothetical protein JO021_12190 [Alphaproteobacteria bacterium]|nr:hypothetical protein [Alphaproteobacteria bacterium]
MSLLFGLGTFVFPYATGFYAHSAAGGLAIAAFDALRRHAGGRQSVASSR